MSATEEVAPLVKGPGWGSAGSLRYQGLVAGAAQVGTESVGEHRSADRSVTGVCGETFGIKKIS